MNIKPIYVTRRDHERLKKLMQSLSSASTKSRGLENLQTELARANVVDISTISEDLVTLDSDVAIRDLDSNELEEYTLTMPEDADPSKNRISVLAPVGVALLGYSVGDVVTWETPGGNRKLRIEKVKHRAITPSAIPPYFPAELLGESPSA